MKILSTLSLLALSTFLFSCSSSDSDNNNEEETPNFAMTAKINNVVFEANNPFGSNDFSTTNLWDFFPEEDYVMLQARQGGILGNPEINLWLKRSDIAEGTYSIGQETFSTQPSHFIDLNDLSNDISEYTKSGTIVITDVNTSTKIVKGTFQFETVDELDNTTADINVTNGTFNYKYE